MELERRGREDGIWRRCENDDVALERICSACGLSKKEALEELGCLGAMLSSSFADYRESQEKIGSGLTVG